MRKKEFKTEEKLVYKLFGVFILFGATGTCSFV